MSRYRFGDSIRSIKYAPNLKPNLIKNAQQANNNLLVKLFNTTPVSTDFIGELPYDNFARGIRNGTSERAIVGANPALLPEAQLSSPYVQSLNRESVAFPERNTRPIDEASETLRNDPATNLDDVTSAADLKNKAESSPKLKKNLDALDAKTKTSNSSWKFLLVGAIITIAALGFYAALEYLANLRSGCYRYTTNANGTVTICKVISASCYSKELAEGMKACDPSTLPKILQETQCGEESSEACQNCNYETIKEEKDIKSNEYFECKIYNWTDMVGELFYKNGILALKNSSAFIFRYLAIFLIIIAVLFVAWIGFTLFKNIASSSSKKKEIIPYNPYMTVPPPPPPTFPPFPPYNPYIPNPLFNPYAQSTNVPPAPNYQPPYSQPQASPYTNFYGIQSQPQSSSDYEKLEKNFEIYKQETKNNMDNLLLKVQNQNLQSQNLRLSQMALRQPPALLN